MSRPSTNPPAPPALDVIEDATSLLRGLPAAAWLAYMAGSIVFLVALLHFCADMSRAADAAQRLVPAGLRLALAYVAMKHLHALFGHCLLDRLQGGPGTPPRLPLATHFRVIAGQAMLHATMPWMMLLSLLAMIPAAWTYAAYHNASILAVSSAIRGDSTSSLASAAIAASHHAVRQNHWLVSALSIISFLAFLNVLALTIALPFLLKMLTGAENPFTINGLAILNTTVLAAVFSLTWLLVSPLARAAYAVRCFHFVSRANGDDLRAELRALPAVALVVAFGLFLVPRANAADAAPVAPPGEAVISKSPENAAALDKALDKVLSHPDFQWRLPKQPEAEEDQNWFEKTAGDFFQWLKDTLGYLVDKLDDFLRWLFGRDRDLDVDTSDNNASDAGPLAMRILTGLLVIAGLVLLVMLVRWFLQRRAAPPVVSTAVTGPVDLADESITASDLPEDEWLRLAREKWSNGDHRLAIRALFLGTLARLGESGLLAISAGKTNGIYVHEIQRKPQADPTLRAAFHQNVRDFEGIWYGSHPISGDVFDRFSLNHETIRRHASPS